MSTMTDSNSTESYNEVPDPTGSGSHMNERNDSFNGYANRETWAFNLHWQNDQWLYNTTLSEAQRYLGATYGSAWMELPEDELRGAFFGVGEYVAGYWRETIDVMNEDADNGEAEPFSETLKTLRTFDREVGSWWRIDYAEVGAAVRESLEAES